MNRARSRNGGRRGVEYVKDGQIVGLGTGSRAYVVQIGRAGQEGTCASAAWPHRSETPLATRGRDPLLADDAEWGWTLAPGRSDQVDPRLNLIKGGVAPALEREDCGWAAAARLSSSG